MCASRVVPTDRGSDRDAETYYILALFSYDNDLLPRTALSYVRGFLYNKRAYFLSVVRPKQYYCPIFETVVWLLKRPRDPRANIQQ